MKVISAEQVTKLPRGRKAVFNANLVKTLSTIKPGSFGVLEAGDMKGENLNGAKLPAKTKEEKGKVGGILRKHFEAAHKGAKAEIRWTEDGFPQVGAKANASS